MDDQSPDPSQSAPPPTYAGPEAPDLKAERAWSAVMGTDDAGVVALLDDGVVLNDGRGGAFAIGTDGKKRWVLPKTLKLSAEVPEAVVISEFGRSVGPDSPEVIAAAYQSRGPRTCWSHPRICDGDGGEAKPDLGIVALSADDGTPWSTVLEPSLRTGTDPEFIYYDVKIVTDTAVVVEIVPELYDKDGKPTRTPLTVALDAKTGQQLWSQYGLAVDWGSGDRILARRLTEPTRSSKGYPELLDARTGQRREVRCHRTRRQRTVLRPCPVGAIRPPAPRVGRSARRSRPVRSARDPPTQLADPGRRLPLDLLR